MMLYEEDIFSLMTHLSKYIPVVQGHHVAKELKARTAGGFGKTYQIPNPYASVMSYTLDISHGWTKLGR